MIQIAAWLGTLWGRVALGAGVVGVLVGLRVWDVSTQQAKGAVKVVEASKKAGAEANAKNEKVRAVAREPGAAERLRKDRATCRDC